MTAIVTYQKGLRTTCSHVRSGNTFIRDAPPDNHGKGEAFSLTDLAATSLATCMLTVMGIYAERNHIRGYRGGCKAHGDQPQAHH